MVQYSLPGSFGEELPDQSGDIEEIAHSSSSIFPKENEERCLDSAPQKNRSNYPMHDEQTSKIPL